MITIKALMIAIAVEGTEATESWGSWFLVTEMTWYWSEHSNDHHL